MIFGNFAENYEFAAMKSAGISLQRAMLSVSLFILLLSVTTFFFANNVIPWGEYKSRNLRRQIAVQAPKMLITEGQFNKVGNSFTIKVEEKYGDEENLLRDITVFLTENRKNKTVIKAETGKLIASKETNTLQLILNDGNFYDDQYPKDPKKKKRNQHVKSSFKKYTKNFDLSALNKTKETEELITYRMLKINELIPTIDSLEQKITRESHKDLENIYNGYLIQKRKTKRNEKTKNVNKAISKKFTTKELTNKRIRKDSLKPIKSLKNNKGFKKIENKTTTKKDSLNYYEGNIIDLFNDKDLVEIYKHAITTSKSNYKKIENREKILDNKKSNLNLHKIAFHKKFALAFSCFILFFIGAPLGAIIRKGGMGLPMVLAIVLFLSYYFIGLFAENFAKKSEIPSYVGAWLSTIILFPLGIILTKNATSDKGIFSTNGIMLFFTNIWKKITKEKSDSNPAQQN